MRTVTEGARGCGYRAPGGLYLMSDGAGEPCPKLPIELRVCPVCGSGIKPTRGFTWIEPDAFTEPGPHGSDEHSARCPLSGSIERAGLVWIGGAFYTARSFTDEAERMGVSRRIPALPRGFEIGETWVFCAHREAEWEACPECGDAATPADCPACDGVGKVGVPAIFHLFRPERVEYVVRGDESPEELDRLESRGIEPVIVKRAQEQAELT